MSRFTFWKFDKLENEKSRASEDLREQELSEDTAETPAKEAIRNTIYHFDCTDSETQSIKTEIAQTDIKTSFYERKRLHHKNIFSLLISSPNAMPTADTVRKAEYQTSAKQNMQMR